MNELKLGKRGIAVSPNLFGIFLEDINYAADGGLNANMVANYSFGGVYPKKSFNMLGIYVTKHFPGVKADRLRYWRISGGSMESCPGAPGKSEWYAKVKAAGNCLLKNYGYNGNDQYKDLGGMGIRAGETYHFSAYLKSEGFTGIVRVYAEDDNGTALTDTAEVYCSESWQQASCSVKADRTAYGRLVIAFEGAGDIDIDCVCFEPDDVWGRDDPKWSVSHMRRDLVEALRELNPSMLRFPGGCIVEGTVEGNEYEWKKTVGPLIDREENSISGPPGSGTRGIHSRTRSGSMSISCSVRTCTWNRSRSSGQESGVRRVRKNLCGRTVRIFRSALYKMRSI